MGVGVLINVYGACVYVHACLRAGLCSFVSGGCVRLIDRQDFQPQPLHKFTE